MIDMRELMVVEKSFELEKTVIENHNLKNTNQLLVRLCIVTIISIGVYIIYNNFKEEDKYKI
jgi:hypothetical protein